MMRYTIDFVIDFNYGNVYETKTILGYFNNLKRCKNIRAVILLIVFKILILVRKHTESHNKNYLRNSTLPIESRKNIYSVLIFFFYNLCHILMKNNSIKNYYFYKCSKHNSICVFVMML